MGLDMNLYKRRYIKNYDHDPLNQRFTIELEKGGETVFLTNPTHVTEEVIYWRKANAIHNYFIQECADGDENRTSMEVSREALLRLLERCEAVINGSRLVDGMVNNGKRLNEAGEWEDIKEEGKYIENPELAQELLPTTEGFFFGSTDYDEWYLDTIKRTRDALKEELSNGEDWTIDYYYECSW